MTRVRQWTLAGAATLVVGGLCWWLFFSQRSDRPVRPSAFPAAAAAALLDGRPRRRYPHEAEVDYPEIVRCLSVAGRELAEILPLRRHDRSTVVAPEECALDDHDDVIHLPTGAPAMFLRYGGFHWLGQDVGSATVRAHCGLLCGGEWTVVLRGADDVGWWVLDEQLEVIY